MQRPEFDKLLTEWLPVIERVARRNSAFYGLTDEWKDIVQSACLKMLRFADSYDPAKGDLLPWACVIANNTIKNRLAQLITCPDMAAFNELMIEQTPASSERSPDNELQLSMVLANLNQETRLFVEGYNYPEIAARCGFRSPATAMARIDKCAGRLALILGISATRYKRVRMYAKKPD